MKIIFNMKNIIIIALILVAGCRKKDEGPTRPYMIVRVNGEKKILNGEHFRENGNMSHLPGKELLIDIASGYQNSFGLGITIIDTSGTLSGSFYNDNTGISFTWIQNEVGTDYRNIRTAVLYLNKKGPVVTGDFNAVLYNQDYSDSVVLTDGHFEIER